MKISSIVDIIDGSLLNSPSISFIYSIKTNVRKIKEGDLFIAKNSDDIELAIKNGAFAIIIEKNLPIIDNEIAWIKVEDINLAVIKLVRFKLAVKNIKAYYCENSTYALLKIFSNYFEKNVKLIPYKLENIFKYLDDIDDGFTLISSNKNILEKIYPTFIDFEKEIKKENISNLIEHSLFETTFSYKELFFSRMKMSSLYILDFIKVFNFINKDLDLTKLKSFQNFKPIFLDKSLHITESGKSDKFIICQDNKELIKNEISYIKEKYKYAKTLFISLYKTDFLSKEEYIQMSNIEDLKPILKNEKFNCVYIIGFNHKDIFEYFTKTENSNSLF